MVALSGRSIQIMASQQKERTRRKQLLREALYLRKVQPIGDLIDPRLIKLGTDRKEEILSERLQRTTLSDQIRLEELQRMSSRAPTLIPFQFRLRLRGIIRATPYCCSPRMIGMNWSTTRLVWQIRIIGCYPSQTRVTWTRLRTRLELTKDEYPWYMTILSWESFWDEGPLAQGKGTVVMDVRFGNRRTSHASRDTGLAR